MAVAYYSTGDMDGQSSVHQAIEIKPDDAQAYFGLGMAFAQKGDKAAALRCHETLRRLDTQLAERLLKLIR
jgi:Flp pilus assembly protein TadD